MVGLQVLDYARVMLGNLGCQTVVTLRFVIAGIACCTALPSTWLALPLHVFARHIAFDAGKVFPIQLNAEAMLDVRNDCRFIMPHICQQIASKSDWR